MHLYFIQYMCAYACYKNIYTYIIYIKIKKNNLHSYVQLCEICKYVMVIIMTEVTLNWVCLSFINPKRKWIVTPKYFFSACRNCIEYYRETVYKECMYFFMYLYIFLFFSYEHSTTRNVYKHCIIILYETYL